MHLIDITTATPEDASDVIRLWGALHRYNAGLDARFELAAGWETLVQEYLAQSQDSHDSVWFLACRNGVAIGFVLVEVHTDSPLYRHRRWAEIVGLYVEPSYRGGDVAERLMERAYDWALRQQLHVIQLYVTSANLLAQRFYTKQGFVNSQLIMRRFLSDTGPTVEPTADHSHQRLHFSEGGARPIDMHGHRHTERDPGAKT